MLQKLHMQIEIIINFQIGKFVLHGGDIRRAILMLSTYFLLNFANLCHEFFSLSSLDYFPTFEQGVV